MIFSRSQRLPPFGGGIRLGVVIQVPGNSSTLLKTRVSQLKMCDTDQGSIVRKRR